jgi:rRNA maturation endonuclease Nob1
MSTNPETSAAQSTFRWARWSGFRCMECGKRFRTVQHAEKAAMDGCPKCGGVDVDHCPDEVAR